MIAILYPFKMDKLSEAYSAIYEAPLHPNLQKNEDNIKKKNEALAAKNKQRDADRAKSAAEFQAHKKDVMSKGGRPVDALDSWQQKKLKKEGKYRAEWETLKLLEKEDYRETFDTWLTGLAEEGYDIDRWTDEELVEAFINENNLWGASDMVLEALLEEAEELNEVKDKKGKGSGTKDACYHKVKARYDVWPSAYASGALSKCRKVGAKNWGNSSKKEEVDYSIDEIYQGKHGQTEKQYQDSRSDAGKMVSGDSKGSGAGYSSRSMRGTGPNPAGGSKKPEGQGRMTSGARTDLQFRKVALKKKEAEKKESMKNEEFIDEAGIGAAVGALSKGAIRAGIKVGGKTGGKIVKSAIKHGGQELKNQAIQTAGDAAAAAVRKGGEKVRKQLPQDDTNVNEMAMANPVNQSNQRQQLQKAKQAQIAKRALVNKLIKKDNKQDTKLQQKVAQIQMSSFSNWRDELDSLDEEDEKKYTVKKLKPNYKHQRYAGSMKFVPFDKIERLDDKIEKAKEDRAREKHEQGKRAFKMLDKPVKESALDENRMTAYNAGAGEGMEDRGISKSLADKMGRSNDESAFSRRKTSGKFNKDYNKKILKDKKPRSNTTGRGTPQQYRKGYEDRDMGRYQSKIVQGKGSIKDLGKKK